jgi:hypothetical protein
MSPLSALAPDQRAVLELLLRQDRDYAELSELLGLPEAAVRERAHTALAALAPDRPAPVGEDGAVADWILGQQDDAEAEATSGSIARMPAWHRWASDVLDRLSEVDGAELPELPQPQTGGETAAQTAVERPEPQPRRKRPVRDATAAAGAQHARRRADAAAASGKSRPAAPAAKGRAGQGAKRPAAAEETSTPLRSSRKGGLVLLAGAALAVAVVLFFVFRSGDGDQSTASTGATPTPTASAEQQPVAELPLKGVGNQSQGLMRVFQQQGGAAGLQFALAVEKIPANRKNEVYGVWFTKKGGKPRALGFSQSQVGKQGVFTAGGPQKGQEADFAKWLADYDAVVIARAPVSGKKTTQLGPVVVRGTLPGGQN